MTLDSTSSMAKKQSALNNVMTNSHFSKKVTQLYFKVLHYLPQVFLILRHVLLYTIIMMVMAIITMYYVHAGFRRSIQFWSRVIPMLIDYKFSELYHKCYHFLIKGNGLSAAATTSSWKLEYHERLAPKLLDLIISMGGIYVKLGQLISTAGTGILPDSYVSTFTILQDGLPPRSHEEISNIVTTSLQLNSMDEMFASFDEHPIGAASIAQAHKATLHDGSQVLVKVQYPEVEQLYHADFNNLLLVVKRLLPDQVPAVEALRQRHLQELDFRNEAQNLITCNNNLQHHDKIRNLVKIPKVIPIGISKNVLVMEYLEGISLKSAMQQEYDMVAHAIGMENGKVLYQKVMNELKETFNSNENDIDAAGKMATRKKSNVPWYITNSQAQSLLPKLLRGYANVKTRVSSIFSKQEQSTLSFASFRFDLNRILKTLVLVHGYQVMIDGLYNADPHAGNVLILPDGKIGLIDYGMVGHLSQEQRNLVASTVHAFATGDKDTVVYNYFSTGYRVAWKSNYTDITTTSSQKSDEIFYRFASFHLHKMDLSPIQVGSQQSQPVPILKVLEAAVERATPDWIEQMKRLGIILMGVSAQAGRPITLSHEWLPIAKQVIRNKQEANKGRREGGN